MQLNEKKSQRSSVLSFEKKYENSRLRFGGEESAAEKGVISGFVHYFMKKNSRKRGEKDSSRTMFTSNNTELCEWSEINFLFISAALDRFLRFVNQQTQ